VPYTFGNTTYAEFLRSNKFDPAFKDAVVKITVDFYHKLISGKALQILKKGQEYLASTSENLFENHSYVSGGRVICLKEMSTKKLIKKLLDSAFEEIEKIITGNLFMVNMDKEYGVCIEFDDSAFIVSLWAEDLVYNNTESYYAEDGSAVDTCTYNYNYDTVNTTISISTSEGNLITVGNNTIQ